MKRVVIDVDGVVADFTFPFWQKLVDQGAKMLPVAPDGPDMWDWYVPYGATKEQAKAAWAEVCETPRWWMNLPVHADVNDWALALLDQVTCKHETTFVTTRPCGRMAVQEWLMRTLGIYKPHLHVLLNHGKKEDILAGMQPHYVIEDKHETLANYYKMTKERSIMPAKLLLVDRPYNRGFNNEGLTVVKNTEEALRIVVEGK